MRSVRRLYIIPDFSGYVNRFFKKLFNFFTRKNPPPKGTFRRGRKGAAVPVLHHGVADETGQFLFVGITGSHGLGAHGGVELREGGLLIGVEEEMSQTEQQRGQNVPADKGELQHKDVPFVAHGHVAAQLPGAVGGEIGVFSQQPGNQVPAIAAVDGIDQQGADNDGQGLGGQAAGKIDGRQAPEGALGAHVEGGDDAMLYGVGVSYNGTEGVMKQSTRDVLSFNIDLRYRKGQFSFDNKFTLDYTESQNPPQSFSVYVQTNPYYSKDFEGDIPKYLEETVIDGGTQTIRVSNPLYNGSLNYIDGTKETGFRNNFQLEWRPDEALRLRGRISINKSNSKDEYFKSPFHTDFDNVEKTERGSYSKSTNEQRGYDGDVTITYGKLLGEMHQVNAVAGWNFSSTKNINDSYTAIGFPDDNVSNPAFSNTYAENSKPTYSESTSRSTSVYLNGNYSYNNRYLFDINVRADGSSVFGINKRFTTSWSVGLAWNIHNENFVGDWADWLKLRFSVGNPGNQNFSAYKAYTTYVYNTSLQNAFDMGANVSEHGNPDLEWQKTMDYNVGFDLAVLNNRLKVNTDFYLKDTDPMLVNTSIASSTGRTSFTTNLGAQRTKGLSFNVVGMPIQNTEKQLTWSITLNGRHQVQTYRNIGNSLDLLNDELQGTSLVRYRDGGSPTDIWAVRSAGIDPMSGEEIYIKKNGLLTFEYDVNDEVIVGNTEPMLEGVVGSNLYYKGFTVSAYFRYRINADYFNSELYNRIENIQTSYVTAYNQDKRALYDRRQKPGDHAQYKRITNTIANNTTAPMTSRYVQKENSFSGESISMSYDFRNQKWLEKVFLDSLTLRANLNDIFYSSTIRAERGTSYPFARTVSFTVNMTF